MASGRMEFRAESIMQHANFAFVLPNDVYEEEIREPRHYEREPYNLILLHGLTGTDTDWLFGGLAQEMALQFNLNIFMPTVGNTFYLDKGYAGGNWCEYIGSELPDFVSNAFRIRMKRENTMIGGLSMGGFGAIHTALAHPDRFGSVIALSSALIINEYASLESRASDVVPKEMMRDLFGDPAKVRKTDANPEFQYLKLKEEGADIPKIYFACGTEDPLIGHNREFAAFLKKEGADYIFEQGPGIHNWRFWNEYLERGLNALL